jgi:hypothetical protein
MNESVLRKMVAKILREMIESQLEEDSLVTNETIEEETIDEEWELGSVDAVELADHNGRIK